MFAGFLCVKSTSLYEPGRVSWDNRMPKTDFPSDHAPCADVPLLQVLPEEGLPLYDRGFMQN